MGKVCGGYLAKLLRDKGQVGQRYQLEGKRIHEPGIACSRPMAEGSGRNCPHCGISGRAHRRKDKGRVVRKADA